MVRKALPAIIVALFLIASAAPFLITINSDEQNLAGDPPTSFDPSWIPISTPQELALIGSGGDYPVNGKYYLTQDIDFNGVDLNGGFDVRVDAGIHTTAESTKTVSVGLYYNSNGAAIKSGSIMMVSLNGEIKDVPINQSIVYFTVPIDTSVLEIVAGGAVNNIPTGLDSSHTNFAVAAELTLSGTGTVSAVAKSNGNMNPLGDFRGTFDGNGKRIIGSETSSFASSGTVYTGLFGRLQGSATFKDLGLEGGSTVSVSTTTARAGGLVGEAQSVTLTMTDCYTTNSVTVMSKAEIRAGGLVGFLGNAVLKDCYNAGKVTIFSSSSATYAGGLSGYTSSASTMTNCYNEGKISSNTASASSVSNSGGLAGRTSSLTVTNCYNIAAIYAKSSAGGLGGNAGTTTVKDCHNEGTITAVNVAGGLVGVSGITTMTDSYNIADISGIGEAGGLAGNTGGANLTGCYSTGNVTASLTVNQSTAGGLIGHTGNGTTSTLTNCYSTGDVTAATIAGGLIGEHNGGGSLITRITGCYTTGDITTSATASTPHSGGLIGRCAGHVAMTGCYTTGEVQASTTTSMVHAGGLIGYTYTNISATIEECFTTGNVKASSTPSSSPPGARAGGLIGTANGNATITNAYVRGDITATIYGSSALKNAYAGGIMGMIAGTSTTAYFSNCYVTGEISSTTARGGITGNVNDSKTFITNCYFLEGIAPELYGGGVVPIIDNRTGSVPRDAQPSGDRISDDLKLKATYFEGVEVIVTDPIFGWDFDSIWVIDENMNDGYPCFRWSAITAHPKDITVNKILGNQFSVSSYFSDAHYQWEKSTDGTIWVEIDGATGSVYETRSSDDFDEMFRCKVGTAVSDSAKIRGMDLTIKISNGTLSYEGGEDIDADTVMKNVPVTEIEFSVAPDTGYILNQVLLGTEDITSTVSGGKFTVDTTSPQTLTVTFATETSYHIDASYEGDGGVIDPWGNIPVTEGNDKTFEFSLFSSDYILADVIVDGISVGTPSSYTFPNVTEDHTIKAIFGDKMYNIVATVNDDTMGTISPSGNVPVKAGGNQTFEFSPKEGYMLSNVFVDGTSRGAESEYTFYEVNGDHTINAVFVALPVYNIVASVDGGVGGTITPLGNVPVKAGEDQIFEISPDDDYMLVDLLVDGESVTVEYLYTFLEVSDDHTIVAVFEALPVYNIVASVAGGVGGTITPSGNVPVKAGEDRMFEFSPNDGYALSGVKVDGGSVETGFEYIFLEVNANHTIVVSFTALEYYIYVDGDDEAKAELNIKPSMATIEDTVIVTLTPFEGYEATITGVDVGTLTYNDSDGCWEIRDINANCTITVSIVPLVYHIIVDDDYDDTIVTLVDISETEVTIESVVNVTLTVIDGYSATISVDVGTLTYNDSDGCWIITDINADCTITILINKNEEPGSGINLMWIVVIIIIAVAAGIGVYVSRKKK